MLLSKVEIIKAGLILMIASLLMWAVMIRPHSYAWEAAGETSGTVKSLMSNATVIGPPQIRAVVTLEDGQQILLDVPTQSNVRAGDSINVYVQADADKPSRRRYSYKH